MAVMYQCQRVFCLQWLLLMMLRGEASWNEVQAVVVMLLVLLAVANVPSIQDLCLVQNCRSLIRSQTRGV